MSDEIIKRLLLMAELFNKDISKAAAKMIYSRLQAYPEAMVIEALNACVDELKFFPSVAEIIGRIDTGHPAPEKAWAMLPKTEQETALLTDEMFSAFGVVYKLMQTDVIAARKAFLETYEQLYLRAKRAGHRPNWQVSLGHDKSGRETVVKQAVHDGLLEERQAVSLLGYNPVGDKRQTASMSDIIKQLDFNPKEIKEYCGKDN